MFLLIFATAVGSSLGSLPSGRLGDLWGRRRMMLLFVFGIGASGPLTLLGPFASIHHPVGIPMLLQRAPNPGAAIGINGLAGNLGIAVAALSTGFMVQWFGWRAAFALPGLLAIGCGQLFARVCPQETEAPAKRSSKARVQPTPSAMARVFAIMTAASVTGGLLFNFTTNGHAQLLSERFRGIVEDPGLIGVMLAAVWLLGPVVKAAGFGTLFGAMAMIAGCTAAVVLALPAEQAD